jgi:hypothetical protein
MSQLIPHSWAVPTRLRERMGRQAGRQRLMQEQGHLLLVLHDPPDPSSHVRQHKLYWRSAEGVWQASDKGGLKALIAHLERQAKTVDALEATLANATAASEFFAALTVATPLARTVRNTFRVLADARDAAPSDGELVVARDQAYETDREAELLLQRARDGLDFSQAQANEAQSRQAEHALRAAHRLNMLAALFFPVTAVATVFGMQLEHGLEHRAAPWTFWAVVVLATLIGLAVRGSIGRAARDTGRPSAGPATR